MLFKNEKVVPVRVSITKYRFYSTLLREMSLKSIKDIPQNVLFEHALKLLNMSSIELTDNYLKDLVEIVEGDLLECNEQVVVHQCNCVSVGSKGLSKAIFDRWPETNVYKNRKQPSKPGTISMKAVGGASATSTSAARSSTTGGKRYVCNMFAQFNTGPPESSSLDDTSTQRCLWFNSCLNALARVKNLKSVAFPYGIGCGLAAGKPFKENGTEIDEELWSTYLRMIRVFAYNTLQSNPKLKVRVYKKGVPKEEKTVMEYVEKKLKTRDSVDVYPDVLGIDVDTVERALKVFCALPQNDGRSGGDPVFYEHYQETYTLKKVGSKWVCADAILKEGYLDKILKNHDGIPQRETSIEVDMFTVMVSKYGNNPLLDEYNYDDTTLAEYTYEHAVTVSNFREWLPFFESVRDLLEDISEFLVQERGETVYPPLNLIYTAFNLCPLKKIRVVILGQDPYPHRPGEAMGLSFSVPDEIEIPSSLKNIYKELTSDGYRASTSGNLTKWAKHGVFMINTSLTVREKKPGSHIKEWKEFADRLIRHISYHCKGVVFILWGGPAQKRLKLIDESKHHILGSSHPSGLSAYSGNNPFITSKPFSRANALLKKRGEEIDWNLS